MLSARQYFFICQTILLCLQREKFVQANTFGVSLNVITILEGQTHVTIPNFITNTSKNSPGFLVQAIRYRVPVSSPSWISSQSADDTGGLFVNVPIIDPYQHSLNFSLSPLRNGFVRFIVYAKNASVTAQNFSILVKEVNQPPFFVLSSKAALPIRINVGSQTKISGFFMNISAGGWGEEGQALFFTWQQTFPMQAVVSSLDFQFSPDLKNASLVITSSENAWGNGTLNITLHDSQGGSFSRLVSIQSRLQNLSQFIHFAVDMPCDIEKDLSVCRQNLNILGNLGCDGIYNWSNGIERKLSTIYSLLPKMASFFSGVLSCGVNPSTEGTYILRDFIYTTAGRLGDLPMQLFSFSIAQLPSSSNKTNYSLFEVGPKISSNGTLTFTVSRSAGNGAATTFNITTLSSGADPCSILLTFRVWQGRFQLLSTVAGFQGSGLNLANNTAYSIVSGQACVVIPDSTGRRFYSTGISNGIPVCDETDSCRCQQTDAQYTPFRVDVDVAEAFSSLSMDRKGTLVFHVARAWFGSYYLNITLLSMIQPESRALVLTVLHKNEAPTFQGRNISVFLSPQCSGLNASESTASMTACWYSIPDVFTGIRAGGADERCDNCPESTPCEAAPCQNQSLSFVVDGVEDPAIFSSLPSPSLDGALTFALWPRSRRGSTIYVRLVDDGALAFYESYSLIVLPGNKTASGLAGLAYPSAVGINSSDPISFTILILAEDEKPFFSLARSVDCTASLLYPCTCPDDAEALLETPSCSISEIPSANVLENSGEHVIHSFVTDISSSPSVPNGMTTFALGDDGSVINVTARRQEPLAGLPELSLAVSFALSQNESHVYAAEFQSNTLAFLLRNGSDYNLTLRTRRADGESRFRFVPSFTFDTQNPCHAELLPSDGGNMTQFALMQGCDKLSNNLQYLPSSIQGDALNVAGFGPDAFLTDTSAYWRFNSYSASGELNIPASELFSASSASCSDTVGTFISPSSFVDSTGNFPAATLLYIPPAMSKANGNPNQCKLRLDETSLTTKYIPMYQNAPIGKQPNVLTYLANNGQFEAFQFDRRNVAGLLRIYI